MAVRTIGSTGDYPSVQAWWDAWFGSAGSHVGEVLNENLVTNLVTTGTIVADSMTIRPVAGARHDGRSRTISGFGATMSNSTGIMLDLNATGGQVIVQDMVLEQSGAADSCVINYGGALSLERCVFSLFSSDSYWRIVHWNRDTEFKMKDCVCVGSAGHDFCYNDSRVASEISGNSVDGFARGWYANSSNAVCVNNIISTQSDQFFGNWGNPANGANISRGSSASRVNDAGRSLWYINFYEDGDTVGDFDYVAFKKRGEDLHLVELNEGTLAPLQLAFVGFGTGRDIDDEPRDPVTPDSGADQYIAAPAPTTTPRRMIQDANLLYPGRLIA